MASTIALERVVKRFGETHVVRDVSLRVEAGEFMVLVGPSGCGKSTCLRMIAGLEAPTSGDIAIDGSIATHLPPRERDLSMVFQSYALYPHMTVFQNMAFGLELRKLDAAAIDARVREAADMLGLVELLRRRPKELSGGQRQRVAMGRAIVRRPKAFLFDEPLSNLDAALRVQTRRELAALHDRLGATMIYVTHDQVEAMTLADRIAVLSEGRLEQVGPPMDVYLRPANRFVAGFIGLPTMNFLCGAITTKGERAAFVSDGLVLELPHRASDVGEAKVDRVELGLRPTDISLESDGVPGSVELIEPMGAETLVHTKLDAGRVTVMAAASKCAHLARGDVVHLRFDASRAHLFDADGRAIRCDA